MSHVFFFSLRPVQKIAEAQEEERHPAVDLQEAGSPGKISRQKAGVA